MILQLFDINVIAFVHKLVINLGQTHTHDGRVVLPVETS